jgi:hypothetical protein
MPGTHKLTSNLGDRNVGENDANPNLCYHGCT